MSVFVYVNAHLLCLITLTHDILTVIRPHALLISKMSLRTSYGVGFRQPFLKFRLHFNVYTLNLLYNVIDELSESEEITVALLCLLKNH